MKRLFGLCLLLLPMPGAALAQSAEFYPREPRSGFASEPRSGFARESRSDFASEPRIVYSMAPAGQPAARPRSGLGGGFIEFLFNGGAMDEPARPLPRSRRAPAYAVQPPDPYAAPRPARRRPAEARIAYAAPPANDVRPARGEVAAQFRKQTVPYDGPQAPGTIVIDTAQRYLFLVQEGGTALRYGVGVGRAGFEWNGTSAISRKAEWPDWRPPAEMRKRRPDLPAFMAGGPRNPLGARAMYLGDTLYRIHGSNEPQSIGQAVSSGCIRMRNEDVIDLYERVGIGTTVVVL